MPTRNNLEFDKRVKKLKKQVNPGGDNPKDQLQASASANDAFGQIFDDESNTDESEEKPRSISLLVKINFGRHFQLMMSSGHLLSIRQVLSISAKSERAVN